MAVEVVRLAEPRDRPGRAADATLVPAVLLGHLLRRPSAHAGQTIRSVTSVRCGNVDQPQCWGLGEGAIDTNPVRKVLPPKRRVDPEEVFGAVKRRALTPEEAGRLLACFPLF